MGDWAPVAPGLAILAARFTWSAVRGTESAQAIAFRGAWVRRVLSSAGMEIMAVQTVRNSMMAASLMTTSAILALMGALTIGHAGLQPVRAGSWLDGAQLKVALPIALLAACVVLFSKAVRLYHRSGYTLGLVHGESDLHAQAETSAISELTRAARLYRSGWRAFYAAIATAAWLVSPWLMLATTVVIVALDAAAGVE
ncbi:MAG: DUF599 family protein [Burkholderiales bacterium]